MSANPGEWTRPIALGVIVLVGHTLTAGGKPVARKNKDRNILYTLDVIKKWNLSFAYYFVIGITIRYI